ncbi:MAG: pyridoxal-5-phosphate-dependent protein subunit beta [Deltaproteobacteria bacterium]|nr:pyridoxal-5-phosphate-dependent protein subunit beta [Deltaproteobacteria bacterium]
MIDLTICEESLKQAIQRVRERKILIPTFRELQEPDRIAGKIKEQLKGVGLGDINPLNLFRINWRNDPVTVGGQFGKVNYLEFPAAITGVDARIIALVGKWFPTGSHKVGATYGCLVPRLVTGQFDPTFQKAVWPSTGNFCRGGAYNATLLACESIAILPEGMSRERFEWLSRLAGEVITTPGGESNVKEIFDKCWELRRTRKEIAIFNQFDEYGNHLWHYLITGHAAEEVLQTELGEKGRYAGFVSQSGSAGTLGAGDYLKERFPGSKVAASEALQCPTMLLNGFGSHRIEGIGDKHIPWIHNVRNTDVVMAVDDENCLNLIRLFNEPEGLRYLNSQGVAESFLSRLAWVGISGIGNLLSAIKFAKYFELTSRDVVITVLTDSMDLYGTRVDELRQTHGPYRQLEAARDYHRYLMGESEVNLLELRHADRKRIHNLKYFTWIEQQRKSLEELNQQWNEFPEFWDRIHLQAAEIDRLIESFNNQTGVMKQL